MRVRRAILYTPASEWAKIVKSSGLQVDCICLDLEDGTSINKKEEARLNAARALNELDFGSSEKLIRINPVGSGFELTDLEMILPSHPDGIVLPKAETDEQVNWVDQQIAQVEIDQNWQLGGIRLIAVVETALGILNLRQITQNPRVDAVIFGAEDFTASIGAKRSVGLQEILFARSNVVIHAAAYGKQAIDMVSIDFRDSIKLKIESATGSMLGFDGKQIIHPAQIEIVQSAFTPNQEEIDNALELIRQFDEHNSKGLGAFEFEGKMVDLPLIRQAENIIIKARSAGKI